MKKCPECGKQIHEDSKFCPYCMKKLLKPKENGKVENVKVRYIVTIIACFVLCIVINVVVIVCSNYEKRNVVANGESTNAEETTESITSGNTEATESITSGNTEATESITSGNTEATESITSGNTETTESITSGNTETTDSTTQEDAEKNTEYEISSEVVIDGIDLNSRDVCVFREFITDSIIYYKYDSDRKIIEFDTTRGPRYVVDLNAKKIRSDNDRTVKLIDCSINDNIIVIKLINDIFPKGFTYIINVDKEKTFDTDFMPYDELSNIYFLYEDGRLEFYTNGNNYFHLNYISKEVLVTAGFDAIIQDTIIVDNMLCLKVFHRGYERSNIYMFDLSKNRKTNTSPINGSNSKMDDVLYLKVDKERKVIVFDTMKGPQYTIDYYSGEIIDTTCLSLTGGIAFAEVRYFEKRDNIIIITLYSSELPEEITYIFDISDYM